MDPAVLGGQSLEFLQNSMTSTKSDKIFILNRFGLSSAVIKTFRIKVHNIQLIFIEAAIRTFELPSGCNRQYTFLRFSTDSAYYFTRIESN